jgi:preprotein translocase subunit SecD
MNTESGSATFLRIIKAVVLIGILGYLSYFVYSNAIREDAAHPFKLGLDLAGGSRLVYQADTTKIDPAEVPELMNVLRAVIETRVNRLGTEENVVYVERSSIVSGEQKERLVVELPGVTDVDEAVAEIGRTPLLEFKLLDLERAQKQDELLRATNTDPQVLAGAIAAIGDPYIDTGLTGRYLESAGLEFAGSQTGQLANEPIVSIKFNAEGSELFADITREHTGEQLAIFLDGQVISAPNINEPIVGGSAVISGGFTAVEARALAENLNFGALPVPIDLVSTQTIDATLGAGVLSQSWEAGVVGFAIISLFMVLWYRVAGLVASIALGFYIALSLALFMFVPVTLTAAGLAGFVLSLGMAVDANVLIFERMKEEYRAGKGSREAAQEGFKRAWSAIKDSNVTGLISAAILFWFGTSLIKGFALVLGLGILTSMLSAIVFTRTLLIALPNVKREDTGIWSYLFGIGLIKK